MFVPYNPNPSGKNVGDCTVRAISKATGRDWWETYMALCVQGYMMNDMPTANSVWGAFLHEHGFARHIVPDSCPVCYTVNDFAAEHPVGTYILALSGHVVCVEDGVLYDSWDSGNEIVLYYWEREE